MQIKAITMNIPGVVAQPNTQAGKQQAQSAGEMFGPQCKVSISKEGRKLSERQTAQKEESAQSVGTQRKLLRQQEEDERQKEIRQGYREELKNVEDEISALNRSYQSRDTLDQRAENIRTAMSVQRDLQEEENQKRAKEAQQLAMQTAGYQEEIDENNRDLVTLLRTMEEAEEAKEERESGEIKIESNGGGAAGTEFCESSMIRDSAVQFMTSSVEREQRVLDGFADQKHEGHQLIRMANEITQDVIAEGKNIMASINDEDYPDDEIEKLMEAYRSGMEVNYKDVEDARKYGQFILNDTRVAEEEHLRKNPLGGMLATKRGMMLTAADAAVNEVANGHLGEGSRELADEVQKLIDERNSMDRIQQNKEELEEEQEQEAEEKQAEMSGEGVLTASNIE